MKKRLVAVSGIMLMLAVGIFFGVAPVMASTERECTEAGYKYHGGWCYSRSVSSIGQEEAKNCNSDGGSFRKAGSQYYCVIDVSSHGSPGSGSGLNGGSDDYNSSSSTGGGSDSPSSGDYSSNDNDSGTTWVTDNSQAKSDNGCNGDGVKTNLFGDSCVGGTDGIFAVLNVILNVLTWGVGIAGTLGIVITGITYMTAKDDVVQMTKAKNRLIHIIIGLAVYAVMWGFLQWLLPGGIFGN